MTSADSMLCPHPAAGRTWKAARRSALQHAAPASGPQLHMPQAHADAIVLRSRPSRPYLDATRLPPAADPGLLRQGRQQRIQPRRSPPAAVSTTPPTSGRASRGRTAARPRPPPWFPGRATEAGVVRPGGQPAPPPWCCGRRSRASCNPGGPTSPSRSGIQPRAHRLHDGPAAARRARSARRAVAQARAAGLAVGDLREQAPRGGFQDIGAVVYLLRKVLWTVPGFTVDRYREQLASLHDLIQAEGPFVSHAQRFLIEAHEPG